MAELARGGAHWIAACQEDMLPRRAIARAGSAHELQVIEITRTDERLQEAFESLWIEEPVSAQRRT